MDLRRQLSGIPGVIVRANASGGNNQMNRFLSGGNNSGGGRLSLEIRGESLDDARDGRAGGQGPARHACPASPTRASAATKAGPSWRSASIARRRRCSASAPRPSPTRSAPTSPARRRRCSARQGNEYPIIVRLREDERQDVTDVDDVLVSTPQGQVLPAKNLMRVEDAVGPIADPAQEPAADHLSSAPSRKRR